MAPAAVAYFPRVDAFPDISDSSDDETKLPARPSQVGPIFDPKTCAEPLPGHSDEFLEENYQVSEAHEDDDEISPARAPPSPTTFKDTYLFPILNRNEHLRLTMLWYMMRDALQDPGLMSRLQEKVNLVKDFIGWEYCIMGTVDNSNFTRVVTAGLPIVVLPRRESTCSHTINQPNGSVFWVTDLSSDWRFKESPHVKHGGLRSYAGTALLCHTIDGTEVPLGSLCVASDEPNRELTLVQKKALKRVAHMLVKEVVLSRRLARQKQRQKMSETVNSLVLQGDAMDFETKLLDTVRGFYPNATISLQKVNDDALSLRDGTPLPLGDAQDGLWEDMALLEELILTQNHVELKTDKTVRTVLSQAGTFAQPMYLLVESSEVRLVFDDVDAWFIERCARLIWDASQRRLLGEAMRAKESFLRGITHQLRTPIHGVLGAVELLAEELDLRKDALELEVDGDGIHSTVPQLMPSMSNGFDTPVSIDTNGSLERLLDRDPSIAAIKKETKRRGSVRALQFIETINSSGRELMMTVNNILKLNKWAEITTMVHHGSVPCDLEKLETEIVKELEEALSSEELIGTSVIFDNHITDADVLIADYDMLRECIQALVINGVQWTRKGTVTITTLRRGKDVLIEVLDDGIGIDEKFRDVIFQPYEKVDQHTRGAGLGLTLTSKIAEALGGRLSLAWSELGKGSKFVLEFRNAVSADSAAMLQDKDKAQISPTICSIEPDGTDTVHPLTAYVARHLKKQHLLCRENIPDGIHGKVEIAIINFDSDPSTLQDRLLAAPSSKLTICIVPCQAYLRSIDAEARKKDICFFYGPLTARRKKEIGAKVLEHHAKLVQAALQNPTQILTKDLVPKLENRHFKSCSSVPVALLVDDNPINLTLLRMFCKKRGIQHYEATDGDQAVQIFEIKGPDRVNLVLMDLQMPVCDGIQATSKIRELEASRGQSRSAIFMVTGQDSPKDKAESLEAGADEFMVKPVKMKTLDEMIQTYFGASANGPS